MVGAERRSDPIGPGKSGRPSAIMESAGLGAFRGQARSRICTCRRVAGGVVWATAAGADLVSLTQPVEDLPV